MKQFYVDGETNRYRRSPNEIVVGVYPDGSIGCENYTSSDEFFRRKDPHISGHLIYIKKKLHERHLSITREHRDSRLVVFAVVCFLLNMIFIFEAVFDWAKGL